MIPTSLLRKAANKGKKKEVKKEKSMNFMDRIEECDRQGQHDLDLTNLKLTAFPQETIVLANIRLMYAHGNAFATLPSFGHFRSIEHVDLSRGALQDIEEMKCSSLVSLKFLNLSRNQLTKLPDDIGRLVNLETLLIDRNQIETFPEGMHPMRNLVKLDASHNKLVDVGTKLDRLAALDDLNFNMNPSLNIEQLGTRTRRLHEKRQLMASKSERRVLIKRALDIRREVLNREQESIFRQVYETPIGAVDELP